MLHTLAQTWGTRVFSIDEVLGPYIYVFYASFLISWAFTPIMRAVAMFHGIIDRPDQLRKIHKTPVAYLGGVAVFLGWICGLAMSQFLYLHLAAPGLQHVVIKFGIVGGAVVIVALGLWDDLAKIKPATKIAGQVAAACMLLASDIGTHITHNFLLPISVRLGIFLNWTPSPALYDWVVFTTSSALVIAIVLLCCNATNLMDGLDGLCGGVTAIIAGGFVLLAVHLGMYGGGGETNSDAVRVVLALALLGGVLGFVPYNFNPASIFMGDTGSMFLGFACALMIVLMGEVASKWFLAAMVMFALPILDTSLAFARRWVNNRPFFSADKQHFHHQLVSRGLTIRKAVVVLYALSIFFVGCGAAIVFMRTRYAIAFYLVIFCSLIVAAYKMGMVHERAAFVEKGTIGDPNEGASASVDPASILVVGNESSATGPGAGARATGAEAGLRVPPAATAAAAQQLPGAWTNGA